MKDVLIIIPMYNFAEMTKTAIDYALANAGMDVDILVVDDGSAKPFYDDRVESIRLVKNSGFTNAVNQGILWAGDQYKYIHILNNDTRAEPDFIKHLYETMEKDENIAVAGSVRIKTDQDGKVMYENYGADLARGYCLFSADEILVDELDTWWIPFCSVMLSMKAIRYLGLLNPYLRNHCSDNEFCVKARINGWRVVLVTKSKVHHIHQVTMLSNGITAEDDQKRFLEIISGLKYGDVMKEIPIDFPRDLWGKVKFQLISRNEALCQR